MELKEVMADQYYAGLLHDLGYECMVKYTCPECNNTVNFFELNQQFENVVFYKVTAVCDQCKTKCVVHNPNPQE